RLLFWLADTDHIDHLLIARQADEIVEFIIEEPADGHWSEAKRCRHQVEILLQVPGLEQDKPVASLAIFPHRPLENAGDHDYQIGLANHLLANSHVGQGSMVHTSATQL